MLIKLSSIKYTALLLLILPYVYKIDDSFSKATQRKIHNFRVNVQSLNFQIYSEVRINNALEAWGETKWRLRTLPSDRLPTLKKLNRIQFKIIS